MLLRSADPAIDHPHHAHHQLGETLGVNLLYVLLVLLDAMLLVLVLVGWIYGSELLGTLYATTFSSCTLLYPITSLHEGCV